MLPHLTIANEPATLTGQTFVRLLQDLKSNRFGPGEPLRFERMRTLYNVGTAPLREALWRLAETGLVVQEGQKGFRVAPASLENLRDVAETRRFLEIRAAQQAVLEGDGLWIESLKSAFEGFSKVANRRPMSQADRAEWEAKHTNFHQTLVLGCPSKLTKQLWSTVFTQSERYRGLAIQVGYWSDNSFPITNSFSMPL